MASVLVADDAIFLRGMVRRMLEAHGHTVIAEAANGKEAVDQYRLTKPDVVLLDITMPDMDGIEAMRYIRSIDPQAKVVVCTALVHQKMIETAIESGVDGFIVKPFDEEKLVNTIEKLCGSNDLPVMLPPSDMDYEIEEVENFFVEETEEEAASPEETEVAEEMEYTEAVEEAAVAEEMEYTETVEEAAVPEEMEYTEVAEEAAVAEEMEYTETVEEAAVPEEMEYTETVEEAVVAEEMEYTETVEEAAVAEEMEYTETVEEAAVPEEMEYAEAVEESEIAEEMEYTEAKAKERERDLAEVAQKMMSRKAYMKKWRNLTDQEVEEELQQISYEISLIERIGG